MRRYRCIIIDYGHGGEDPATGEYLTPGGKQYTHTDVDPPLFLGEGISNRRTAARLIAHLLGAGVRVEDCVARRSWSQAPASWRALEQSDLPLALRTGYANGVCDVLRPENCLLISLHSNAVGNTIRGPSQSARGVDVYTRRGQDHADPVADAIHAAMKETLPALGLPVRRGDHRDGDADHEANFWILRKTSAASVLTETGFFTNLEDARFLDSETGQDAIAAAIFAGLRPFLACAASRAA
jgi:N-acetylmuramoyl-L-alanine amidase